MNSVVGGATPPEFRHKRQQGGGSTFPLLVNLSIHVPTVQMINPARWLDEMKSFDMTVFNVLWIQLKGSYTSRIQTHVTTRGSLSIPTASRPYYTCSHYAYDEPCKRARWAQEFGLDCVKFSMNSVEGNYTSRSETQVTTRGRLNIPTAGKPQYTSSHCVYDKPCKMAWWAEEFGLDCVKFSINSVEGELHLHNSNTCDNKGASQHSHSM